LARAKIVACSNMQTPCLFHPIGNHTADRRVKIEHIPSRCERQLRDVAYHLPRRRDIVERMSTALAGTSKHELPRSRKERDVNIKSGNRLVISRTIRYDNSDILP